MGGNYGGRAKEAKMSKKGRGHCPFFPIALVRPLQVGRTTKKSSITFSEPTDFNCLKLVFQ